MKNIYFIFPYKGVGGVSVVFSQLASYLARNKKFNIFLVDYIDGAMYKSYDSKSCNFLEYSDNKKLVIPSDSIIVLQAMTPWSIFPNLIINDNVRVFFWVLHQANFLPLLPALPFLRVFRRYMQSNFYIFKLISSLILYPWYRKSREFVSYINKFDSLSFMDQNTFKITKKWLSLNIKNVNYLPVPFQNISKNDELEREFLSVKPCRIIWIGRLVDFKVNVLKLAINRLSYFQSLLGVNIEITIIGDGPYRDKLFSYTNSFPNIKSKFIDHCPLLELNNMLNSNFNIALAMGTSALLSASKGIATILVDSSYVEVSSNYTFSWLHNRKFFTLTDHVNSEHFGSDDLSLYNLLKQYLANPQDISQASFEYYYTNHSLFTVSKLFLNYLSNAKITWKDLRSNGFTSRGYIYRIFKKLFGSRYNEP